MRRLLWLLAVCAAGALVIWAVAAHPWGWLYGIGVHPYPANSDTPWTYQLLSGFVPALTVLGLLTFIAGAWHHVNCRAPGCLRLGHYPDSRSVKWCWRHHPDHQGQRPTLELLHRLHFEHVKREA